MADWMVRRNPNPNCDGAYCREVSGPVKRYPLPDHAGLILCMACWAHENQYRFNTGGEQHNWEDAEVYAGG